MIINIMEVALVQSRVQLALNVSDIDRAVDFYEKLFRTAPAKREPGYANFAIDEPPLKLVLIEHPDAPGRLNHLGVEVFDPADVLRARDRLVAQGAEVTTEEQVTCCYAVQDKVWVQGPGREPWEVYVVKADADILGTSASASSQPDACCGTTACCTPDERAVEPTQTPEQTKAAAGCGCTG